MANFAEPKVIFHRYAGEHVAAVVVYGDVSTGKLYADEKHTTLIGGQSVNESFLYDAFLTGKLLICVADLQYLRPVGYKNGKLYTYSGTTSVAGTEWEAAEESDLG